MSERKRYVTLASKVNIQFNITVSQSSLALAVCALMLISKTGLTSYSRILSK